MANPPQALQEEFGKVVAATVRPLSLGFGLFIGYTAYTELPLVGTAQWPVFAADVVVSLYLLALFAWVQWRPPPLTWMNGLGTSIAVALAGTDMVTNAARATIPSFPAIALVLAGLGAVVLSWRWMLSTVAGMWLAWIVVTQVFVANPWDALFILQISTIAGLAVHGGRMRAYTQLVHARLQEQEARRRYEVVNEELDRFASVVAHDLKNPISALRLKANILSHKLDPRDADSLRIAAELDHVAKGMGDMVGSLLEYARAGERLRSHESVDLDVIMEEIEELFKDRLQRAGGELNASALGTVDAEPIMMRQLLQNLVGNALDHARPDRPPVVLVTATSARGRVTIRVRDNGVGLESGEAETIFQPFARGKESVGHGLGLATCRRIAKAHGGAIEVSSKKGEGSTFTVWLPDQGASVAARVGPEPVAPEPSPRRG